MSVSDLFKLFPVVIDEEENPDHDEWDTDVMWGHSKYRLHISCTIGQSD